MSAAGLSKALDGTLSDRFQALTKVGAAGVGAGSGVQKLENLAGVRPVSGLVESFEKLLKPLVENGAIRAGLHQSDKGFYFFRPHDAVLLCGYEQLYCNTDIKYEKRPS